MSQIINPIGNANVLVVPTALVCAALALVGMWGTHIGILTAVAGMFGYAAYAYWMAREAPFSFALMLDFLFFRGTVLLSGLAITAGAFMPEVNTQGAPSGAFAFLPIVYLVFTLAAALMVEPTTRRIAATYQSQTDATKFNGKLWVYGLMGAIVLLTCYVLVMGAKQGFPLFTHMDRFAYRKLFEGDRLFTAVVGNRVLFTAFLGLIFVSTTGQLRRAAVAIFGLILGTSFLIGDKFTSIVGATISFALPWMLFHAHTYPWRNLKKFLPALTGLMVAICCLTIPATLYTYGWKDNSQEAVDTFLTRIAGQGQLWYAVTEENPPAFHAEPDTQKLDLQLILHPDNDRAQTPPFAGIYKLMALYMPYNVFQPYLSRGITLTLGFEPYLVHEYGWLGMLPILLLCAALYAGHLIYFSYALFRQDPIRLLLALKLLDWLEFGLQQGDFWYIFSINNAGYMLVAVGYEILHRNFHKQWATRA